MFRSLGEAAAAFAALLLAFVSPALAQSALNTGILDLRFVVQDLKFAVEDMGGKAQVLAGKGTGLEVKETATETRIALSADVLFDFDKADILPKAQATLHQVAIFIRTNSGGRPVNVEGHTDSKGGEQYNQRLSERRADAVRGWLVQREGLKEVKFLSRGFGATRPVVPNAKPDGSDDPDGRQKNRRVEIVLPH
jgi:outer membrane protein OmpA-like peptidoglycan-associated protein